VFRIPTEICWQSNQNNECRKITITKKEETFQFNSVFKATQPIIVDPDGWVLKGDPNFK
jgi:hypothetical protein